jgi:hypothetical protein
VDGIVPDTELVDGSRREVLDDVVRVRGDIEAGLASRVGFEIEGDASLPRLTLA